MGLNNASFRLQIAARACRCVPPAISGRMSRLLYPDRLSASEPRGVSASSALGPVRYVYPHLDLIARSCIVRGFYEIINIVIANTICKPGDSIVEIGANIGSETIHYGRIVGATGKVYAFEPVPANADTLRRQVELNRLSSVEVIQKAVSDSLEQLHFSLSPSSDNSGQGSLIRTTDPDRAITVQSITLDAFSESTDLSGVRMLSMDAQGAETRILRGGATFIRRQRPVMLCEVAANWLEQQGSSQDELLTALQDLGYELYRITKWGLVPLSPWPSPDIVAFPRGPEVAGLVRTLSSKIKRAMLLPLVRGINPAVVD